MKRLFTALLFALCSLSALGQYSNHVTYETPGSYTFTWVSGVNTVWFKMWGAGASGSRSAYVQLGGAAASGAYCWGRAARPTSGQTTIVIGVGGSAQSTTGSAGIYGGDTRFGNCYAIADSAQTSLPPPNWKTGTDGGSGGICSGPSISGSVPVDGGFDGWVPGGMGQASAPVMVHDPNPQPGTGLPLWLNASHPMGADAPRGGRGGNNGQSGQSPGGGGAPGNIDFVSGAGGNGRVEIFW